MYLPQRGPYVVWVPTNLPVSGMKKKKQKQTRGKEGERREREGGREGEGKHNLLAIRVFTVLS